MLLIKNGDTYFKYVVEDCSDIHFNMFVTPNRKLGKKIAFFDVLLKKNDDRTLE